MESEPRYWFPAKRYGLGWGLPRAWQGVLVMYAYLAVVFGPMIVVPNARGTLLTLPAIVVATPVLMWVIAKKGEPRGWRWGDRR